MRRHEQPQDSQPATIPVEPAHAATSVGADVDDEGFDGGVLGPIAVVVLVLIFGGPTVAVVGRMAGWW